MDKPSSLFGRESRICCIPTGVSFVDALAHDMLALAAANGDQSVKRLETGLHRFRNRLTRDDAGCLHFNAAA